MERRKKKMKRSIIEKREAETGADKGRQRKSPPTRNNSHQGVPPRKAHSGTKG